MEKDKKAIDVAAEIMKSIQDVGHNCDIVFKNFNGEQFVFDRAFVRDGKVMCEVSRISERPNPAEEFKKLVSEYGNENRLHTFLVCSDFGISFDGSMVDKIDVDQFGDVYFVFNENTGDAIKIDAFPTGKLIVFCNKLRTKLEELTKIQNNL